MKKNYIRFLSIFLAVIVLIFLVFNFGINFWLQNNLAGYIKKNSQYNVAYNDLKVDIVTGDISASAITIENKTNADPNIIGLQGHIDSLSISRLGIYDAVFHKVINSTQLILVRPDLKITLAKPVDDKTGKKRNPVVFENLTIKGGNISIFKHTHQKYFSVKNLDLDVENIQMTEESVERKLPVVFDTYAIQGQKFFFRPNNKYAITANFITTEAGKMSVKNFAVVPLLTFANFTRFYPKENNLFDFKTSEMNFTDIEVAENKISLANAHFENPELKIRKTSANAKTKKSDFNFVVNMDDVLFKNAKISVLKPDGTPKFSAGNLSLNINKFLMNRETSREALPFEYADFDIAGKQIHFVSETENINIENFSFNQKNADFKNIALKPVNFSKNKTALDLNVKQLQLKINELKLVENKLKVDVQKVLLNGVEGKIAAAKKSGAKKANFSGLQFPLKVKNLEIRNSNLLIENEKSPLVLKSLNGYVQNIQMDAETVKNALPFKTGNYSLTTRNFQYRTEFYNLTASLMKLNKNVLEVSNFAAKPLLSRAQFIRRIPTEKDLYDVSVKQISMNGNWDLLSESKYLEASQVSLNQMNANIFRSKLPKDDLTEKPLYSELLRSIKFPMYIQNLDIKNSVLEYEEDTKKSDGPGKLTFGSFNMNVKNLNSGKMKGRPTFVPIAITCRFMNASPMNVKWSFDTANLNDAFAISGNIADLPASRVNPFIEPYLKIQATGLISDLIFNFKGNQRGIFGSLNMKHENLRIGILKESGEKNKLLSAVANIFVKTDSGNYPESVEVEGVERDKTKSFFNLFWRGIEQGLKKTLLGKNAPKTEKSIKNTVDNTKTALEQNKKDLQQTKTEVKEKVEDIKAKAEEKKAPKKRGFFEKIFKKKSEN